MPDCPPCVQNPHVGGEELKGKRRPWNRRERSEGAKQMGHLGHEGRREGHLGEEIVNHQNESGLVERAVGEDDEKEQSVMT